MMSDEKNNRPAAFGEIDHISDPQLRLRGKEAEIVRETGTIAADRLIQTLDWTQYNFAKSESRPPSAAGSLVPLLFDRAAIEANATRRITLVPAP